MASITRRCAELARRLGDSFKMALVRTFNDHGRQTMSNSRERIPFRWWGRCHIISSVRALTAELKADPRAPGGRGHHDLLPDRTAARERQLVHHRVAAFEPHNVAIQQASAA